MNKPRYPDIQLQGHNELSSERQNNPSENSEMEDPYQTISSSQIARVSSSAGDSVMNGHPQEPPQPSSGAGFSAPTNFATTCGRDSNSVSSNRPSSNNGNFTMSYNNFFVNLLPGQKPELKRYKQYSKIDLQKAIEEVRCGNTALQVTTHSTIILMVLLEICFL